MNDPIISVPESWLKRLDELAAKVHKQMEDGPGANYAVYMQTDIAALVGYASSAKTLIKYNDREEVKK